MKLSKSQVVHRQSCKTPTKGNPNGDRPEWNPYTSSSRSSKGFGNSAQTKSVFYDTFSKHQQECLCKQCLCGRHLCKIDSPSPALTLSSTYKCHYPPRKPYRHRNTPHRPFSARQIDSPLLTHKSTYQNSFYELDGDELSRPKPKNMLSCSSGPAMELTSYGQEFPGHRGKNQYVPVNPELFRGGLTFNASSTYSKEYGKLNGRNSDNAKPPDQFSMTGSWLGDSSYKNQYQNPKNHVSSEKKIKKSEDVCTAKKQATPTKERTPSTHFSTTLSILETTYKNDYIEREQAVCPAAKIVEGQNISKDKFKENSHFKGLDSSYVSLAKHVSSFC